MTFTDSSANNTSVSVSCYPNSVAVREPNCLHHDGDEHCKPSGEWLAPRIGSLDPDWWDDWQFLRLFL